MKYSDELTLELCKYIRAGNNFEDSACLVGIGESTLYDWQRQFESDGKPNPNYHVELVEAIKKAEREFKARNIAIIAKAAETSWQAAAWLLERKYNNEYALKQVNELTGKGGGPIAVNLINDYLSEPVVNAAPTGGIERQNEIQDPSMAQESKKDINSTGEGCARSV